MRISELSRASGVPIPSIKYYLRSGLLPPGQRTAPNQADYGQAHLHRLRLIRSLIQIGGLSITAVGDLLSSLDSHRDNPREAVKAVMNMTPSHDASAEGPYTEPARAAVHRLLTERGWDIHADSPHVRTLTAAAEAFLRLGQNDIEELFDRYADVVEPLAAQEVAWMTRHDTPDTIGESAIIGSVIGGTAFNAMRSLAHRAAAARTPADTFEPN